MMEGVLPEAWDLILFKTMVLYIYGITANIIRSNTAYILLGKDFNSCISALSAAWIRLPFEYPVHIIIEAFYAISKLE